MAVTEKTTSYEVGLRALCKRAARDIDEGGGISSIQLANQAGETVREWESPFSELLFDEIQSEIVYNLGFLAPRTYRWKVYAFQGREVKQVIPLNLKGEDRTSIETEDAFKLAQERILASVTKLQTETLKAASFMLDKQSAMIEQQARHNAALAEQLVGQQEKVMSFVTKHADIFVDMQEQRMIDAVKPEEEEVSDGGIMQIVDFVKKHPEEFSKGAEFVVDVMGKMKNPEQTVSPVVATMKEKN